jgi:hypothetical protein
MKRELKEVLGLATVCEDDTESSRAKPNFRHLHRATSPLAILIVNKSSPYDPKVAMDLSLGVTHR